MRVHTPTNDKPRVTQIPQVIKIKMSHACRRPHTHRASIDDDRQVRDDPWSVRVHARIHRNCGERGIIMTAATSTKTIVSQPGSITGENVLRVCVCMHTSQTQQQPPRRRQRKKQNHGRFVCYTRVRARVRVCSSSCWSSEVVNNTQAWLEQTIMCVAFAEADAVGMVSGQAA